MTARGSAFAAAHRVVDRVHGNASYARPDAAPAGTAGLTKRDFLMISVADHADSGARFQGDQTDFAAAHANVSELAFLRHQGRETAGAAHQLSALTGDQFDIVDLGAQRNAGKRHGNVYSRLKFESGAHRVQRVPKTEASGRIHTSTATVLVMPEMEEIDVDLKMEDIQVDTYRSQGAGGQNVNKTESAVRMTHIPTGVVVSCQTEKSQIQNRAICMQMLRAKIYAKLQEEQEEKFGSERKLKVGTGERSEKIRTYNYPQNRVTDHRIGFTIQKLDRVMEGDLDEILNALQHFDQEQKMLGEQNE